MKTLTALRRSRKKKTKKVTKEKGERKGIVVILVPNCKEKKGEKRSVPERGKREGQKPNPP